MPLPNPAGRRFAAIVPVKPAARAKTRLADLPDDQRQALAVAFARDTVAAARSSSRVEQVLVLTDDASFAGLVAAEGCAALPDGVAGDLNATLVQAALECARRWPDLAPLALCADLPALASADLDAALDQLPHDGALFVGDADGTGTTAYAATSATAFDPRFGPGSAAAHAEGGAVPATGDLGSLRRDVDDVLALGAAMLLGVGAHTAAVMGHGG